MLRRGKILSLILTVGMLSANIYGCSSSNNSTEDGVAKISIWTQEGQVVEQEYYKDAIEQFNELYEGQIEALYVRVLESEDLEVKNEATSMLINKYLERNEYKKAQSCIDKLPTVTYDKDRLQGRLYIKKGEFDKASELFSYKLIEATTDIFTILISMMEIALKDGRKEDAKYFAEILDKTTDLYDLLDYNGQVGYFKLYSDEKDADNFVIVLKKMLEAMKKPWNPSKSKLYANMKVNQSEEGFEQFIDTFVNTLKSDVEGELGFVKNNEEFNELINNI